MTNSKRIADALENIVSELKDLNVTCAQSNIINNIAIKNNKQHYNIAIANVLGILSNCLGDDAILYLKAIEDGDLEKANNIFMAKTNPTTITNEIKPEPKKRGRKPKQPQN